MPDGSFFSLAQLQVIQAPASLVPKCGSCGLYRTCKSPKMTPSGSGRRKVLIVGEAPGAEEDERGEAFVGKSGARLRETLRKIGVDPQKDCKFHNAIVCRPPDNATPDENQIRYCRPNLIKVLDEFEPNVVVPLGAVACKSVIGYLWKGDKVGGIKRWAGFAIPVRKRNVWVCPTYHPSYLLRAEDPVLDKMFETHLRTAFAKDGPPWDGEPEPIDTAELILDTDKVARILRRWTARGGTMAFDFETNMLKPDSSAAAIYSCAVCWEGKRTIAYPWRGEAVKATLEMLWAENVRKIGYNLKYEEGWVLAKYKKPVKNWVYCGMNGTHVIDNRPDITGLKFQAFVRFGAEDYDGAIKPYLKTKSGNEVNRIKDVGLTTVLRYNGKDALLEYMVGMQQMRELKLEG